MDLLTTDLSEFGAPPVTAIANALNIARAKNVRGDRSKALAVMGQLMSSPNAPIALDACRGIGNFFTDEFGERDKAAQTGREGAADVNQAIALMMGALSNSDREVRTCAAGVMWTLTGEHKPMSMPGPRTDLNAHVVHWAQWARAHGFND